MHLLRCSLVIVIHYPRKRNAPSRSPTRDIFNPSYSMGSDPLKSELRFHLENHENTDIGVWKPRNALIDAAILPKVLSVGLPRDESVR